MGATDRAEMRGGKALRAIFAQGKTYWLCTSIVAVLCYGFTMTHSSVGVDDELFSRYYEDGLMISQGRWQGPLFHKILNSAEYLPFWREFLGVLLLIIGATIFVYVFNKASRGKVVGWVAAVFTCGLITFPFISNLFIFSSAVTCGINLVGAGLACLSLENTIEKPRNIHNYIFAMLLLLLNLVEYSIVLFLNGYCMVWLLRIVFIQKKDKREVLNFFRGMITAAVVAVAAFFLNRWLSIVIQRAVFGQKMGFYMTSYVTYDFSGNLLVQLLRFFQNFIRKMLMEATSCSATFSFFCSTLIVISFSVGIAIKDKNPLILLAGVAVFLSAIIVPVVSGNVDVVRRTLWTYCLYSGFAFTLLCIAIDSIPILKQLCYVALFLLIFYQTKECNELYFADYQRYQIDQYNANALANDIIKVAGSGETNYLLRSESEATKPILFVGTPTPYSIDRCGDNVTGWSIFHWDRAWDQDAELRSERILAFMKMHGHWFEGATNYDVAEVRQQSYDMPIWPREGSIKEFDRYILAKIGAPAFEYKHIKESREEFLVQHNDLSVDVNACLDSYGVTNDGGVYAWGWGIAYGVPSSKVTIEIGLISDNDQYLIRSPQQTRHDVTTTWGVADNMNYDSSGFSFGGFKTSNMEPGDYNVGIIIEYAGASKTIVSAETLHIE